MMDAGGSLRVLVERTVVSRGDAPAIHGLGCETLTYRALLTVIDAVGSALRRSGIERNDVVGILFPNGPEAATAFLGVSSYATAAPLNPSYRETELEFSMRDLSMRAVLVPPEGDGAVLDVAKRLGVEVVRVSPGLSATSFDPPIGEPIDLAGSDDIALILHTSGTTSRPKAVPLSHRNLTASARNVATTLSLTGADTCLNVMPLFHIHGLVATLLASLHAGASVVCTPGFSAPDFFTWIDEVEPTWYSAVPTMHQAILERASDHRDIISRSRLRLARSSSASLPAQTMTDLEDALGVPVIEAYGMTEAAHQMTSNPLPPARRIPGTVGIAAGPEVAVMDDEGRLVPNGVAGEIVIRGPNVTAGYLQAPEANAEAFVNGWFRTGDLGILDSSGYLTISGRRKEIINRGGETIAPREIDEVLLSHPAVKQALAFSVPDSRLGEQVAAIVVLRPDATNTSEFDLRRFAGLRLSAAKVPRKILFMDDIPKGPTGKLQRIGLAEKLGLSDLDAADVAEYVAPSTAAERLVADLWKEVLGVEDISAAIGFLDAGGDSILATRLLSRVRDAVDVDIDMIEFFDRPTISQQAALVEARVLESEEDLHAH